MASNKPKRAVKLFGTELQEAKGRALRAGPITAVLDNGALRYIRLGDIEVLRAIAFLVRDENWGTYTPEIRNQKIRQTPKGFTVTYDARCGAPGRALAYNAEISAKAEGTLSFTATAKPESDFPTNRTGFVVLHPLKGVAGAPVEIEHVDGKWRKDKFPALINPVQPFLNVRAIRHEVSSGVSATVRMEGDAFETEDHRNWTDASFKTYVRPLALPWPYTLPKGEPFTQSVTLTFSGKLPRPKTGGTARPALVSLGRAAGSLPGIAIAVSAAEAEHAFEQADLLKHAAPSRLLCEIDAAGTDLSRACSHLCKLSEATGIPVSLEIVIPGRTEPSVELEPVVRALDDSGLEPVAVAVSPAIDLKAILPGSAGGDAPPLEKVSRCQDRISGRSDRRGDVFILYRAQPQAPAGRASRLCHSHHLSDRTRCRRRIGDGIARSASLCRAVDARAHRPEEGLSYWTQHNSRPSQSLWCLDREQSRRPPRLSRRQ